MDSIFKNKAKEEEASVIDLKILQVLVIKLLGWELSRLVKKIKPVELWDKGQLSHIVSHELCIECTHVLNVLIYWYTKRIDILNHYYREELCI
jgi:hypothetical protein